MANTRYPIFRDYALQQYIQKQEKDVLLRLVFPPTFLFYWILLIFLLIAGCVAWAEEIPTYVAGTGMILEHGLSTTTGRNQATAVVFVPAHSLPKSASWFSSSATNR